MYMGIAIGSIAAIAVIITVSVLCHRRQHKHQDKHIPEYYEPPCDYDIDHFPEYYEPPCDYDDELIDMPPVSDLIGDLSFDFDVFEKRK